MSAVQTDADLLAIVASEEESCDGDEWGALSGRSDSFCSGAVTPTHSPTRTGLPRQDTGQDMRISSQWIPSWAESERGDRESVLFLDTIEQVGALPFSNTLQELLGCEAGPQSSDTEVQDASPPCSPRDRRNKPAGTISATRLYLRAALSSGGRGCPILAESAPHPWPTREFWSKRKSRQTRVGMRARKRVCRAVPDPTLPKDYFSQGKPDAVTSVNLSFDERRMECRSAARLRASNSSPFGRSDQDENGQDRSDSSSRSCGEKSERTNEF